MQIPSRMLVQCGPVCLGLVPGRDGMANVPLEFRVACRRLTMITQVREKERALPISNKSLNVS